MIKLKKINTVNDFFIFIRNCTLQTRKIIFRGHSSSDYALITGLGRVRRAELNIPFDCMAEQRMLNSFKQHAYSYFKTDFSLIELLAVAQHHGLPTRLLDWTWNPLVAIYFAVRYSKYHKKDGVIYFTDRNKFTFHDDELNPFKIKDLVIYNPIHKTPRITAQSSLFLLNPFPNKPIKDSRIEKVIISKKIKNDIEIILETLGIHHGSLFPGLDGMASYVEWLYTSY